jgi:hypothetical protein
VLTRAVDPAGPGVQKEGVASQESPARGRDAADPCFGPASDRRAVGIISSSACLKRRSACLCILWWCKPSDGSQSGSPRGSSHCVRAWYEGIRCSRRVGWTTDAKACDY